MMSPTHDTTRRWTAAPAAALLVATMLLAAATATAGGDARALAMGGARTASARGLDSATANPAFLAFSEGLTIGLAGGTVDLQNNSFTLARYNAVSGASLSAADKAELLADIPEDGFGVNARADFGAIGMQSGNFAFTTGGGAAGDGNLDKDFFDLVLFGNEPGETVDFSSTGGEGYSLARAGLSWGQPLGTVAGGRLAVGATGSYLQGLYEVHVEEARGSLSTSMTAIEGEAFASAVTAEGGNGFGLDLGLAWQKDGWAVGLALDNAFARIAWDGTVERTEYVVTATDISATNGDFDKVIADSDTTYAVMGYETTLPRVLRLGTSLDAGSLTVAADWVQGFADRAGASTEPLVHLGCEWRPLGFLHPRVGASFGGGLDTGLAAGLGLNVAFWRLDLAALQRGGLGADSGKGLGVGASTRFVF